MRRESGAKYKGDFRAFGGVQRFSFATGLQCLKYSVLVAGDKPPRDDVTKTHLDHLAFNVGGEGVEFLKQHHGE